MLSRDETQRLLRIVARAAPPAERLEARFFAALADQDSDRIDERRRRWCEAAAGGDETLFAELLAQRGLDAEAVGRWLADVEVADPASLPEWASVLFEWLGYLTEANETNPAAGAPPLDRMLASLGRLAARFLSEELESSALRANDQARAQLVSQLIRRMARATLASAELEMRAASAAAEAARQFGMPSELELDCGVEGWLDRLERLPGLAYLIGVVHTSWRSATSELLDRLAADRELLCETYFAGADPGPLAGVQGDAGDVHDGGRAVTLLRFERGQRLVYKPKDLRIAASFMRLVSLLNEWGLDPPLHVRRILPRGAYAWEEFVEQKSCTDEEGVGSFYHRMGMTVRLLQLLEARDFWLDNLVACADQPAFVDLEMLLQPRMRPELSLLPAEQEALRRLEESVAKMGVLSMHLPIAAGLRAEDLGALSSGQRFVSPFRLVSSVLSVSAAERLLSPDGYITWSHEEHVPLLNGLPVDSAGYLGTIEAGYRSMHAFLGAVAERLAAAGSSIGAMAGEPVRYIYRDTWSCQRIIDASVAPALLRDGLERELFFERLYRVAMRESASPSLVVPLIGHEIEAFRVLDVPLFLCMPSSDALPLGDGLAVRGFFEGVASQRLSERLETLPALDLDQQVDFLRTSFAIGHESSGGGEQRVATRTGSPEPERADWLAEAVEVASSILSEAARGPDGDLAWPGLMYHPLFDVSSLDVLSGDVLSGSAGLALLFADLYAMTGERRFQEAVAGALAPSQRAVDSIRRVLADSAADGSGVGQSPLLCGAFYGFGSQIYALRRCARVAGLPALDARAASIVEALPVGAIWQRAPVDLVSGTAGLLVALLAGPDPEMSPAANALIARLAMRHLQLAESQAELPDPPYPHDCATLRSLPGLYDGVALSLARLAYRSSGRDAEDLRLAAERTVMAADARDSGPRPTPGRLLARLALLRCRVGEADSLSEEVTTYLNSIGAASSSLVLLDALEVSLSAWEVLADQAYLDRASGLGAALRQRRRSGSWFPERAAADRHNLSVISGVGGVAHALLRLARPGACGSIRQLG